MLHRQKNRNELFTGKGADIKNSVYFFQKFTPSEHSSEQSTPVIMKKIKKFFNDLGLCSQLFFHDLYLHLPELENGADLSYENCLAFLNYILCDNGKNKQRIEIFKMLDKFGNGHINTNQLLILLKKTLQPWEYEQYSQIILNYGPSINYLQHFGDKKCLH